MKLSRPYRSIALMALCGLSFGGKASAQVSDVGARRDIAIESRQIEDATAARPVIDESIPEMAGDEEFGDQVIIERVSNWYPLSVNTSVGIYQTSNAELAFEDERDDEFLRESAIINFNPSLSGNLFLDMGVSQEFYRYNELSELDFDYLRTHMGIFSNISPGSLPFDAIFGNGFLFANYAYYQVTDGLFGQEAFINHSSVLGFQKTVPIAKGHQIYYGLSSELSLDSSNVAFQRNEHRVFAGYLLEWTEDLRLRAGYVAGVFDYRENDQLDWSHTADFDIESIFWRPVVLGHQSEFYIRGNVSLTLNDSNLSSRDYDYFNWGGGVGMRTSF